MKCFKSPFSLILFTLTLWSGQSLNMALTQNAQAQATSTEQQSTLLRQRDIQVTFEPSGSRKPKNSAGGASRSADGKLCPQDGTAIAPALTPLIPNNSQAFTTAKHPKILVYVPQTSARKVFFSVQDENKNNLYQTFLPITGEAGIVSVQLPEDAPELEAGKTYKWYFTVLCGNALRPDSPRVEGDLQRIESPLTANTQLENSSPLERAALYGKVGIWYDTVATVADLRRSQPEDPTYQATWEQLLNSVGLAEISAQPLLN